MNKEEKLSELIGKYESLKEDLAEIINDYEADYTEDEIMNLFLEASGATDDAIDCLLDIQEM